MLGALLAALGVVAIFPIFDLEPRQDAGKIETLIAGRRFLKAEARHSSSLARLPRPAPGCCCVPARVPRFAGAVEALRQVPEWSAPQGGGHFF